MELVPPFETEEAVVKRLSRPSLARWVLLATIDWAMIAGIFALCYCFWNPLLVAVGVIILGTRQHAIAVLGHEGTHYRISDNRFLNDLLSNLLCFWPLGFDREVYRRFHLKHHLHASTAEDPELEIKAARAPMYDLPTPYRRIVWSFVSALCGWAIPELGSFLRRMPPRSLREALGPFVWHGSAIVLLAAIGQLWIAAIWWGAYCTSYWACFRVRIWTEHHGTSGTNRTHFSWLQKFLFAPNGIGYHYEHHRWPSITCWNLPQARNLLDRNVAIVPMTNLLRSYASLPSSPSGRPVTHTHTH
jgi:fatty acid desaturase